MPTLRPTRRATHAGSALRPVRWSDLESIFDAIFGQECHDLPSDWGFGTVSAYWHDAEDNKYQVSHLSELRQAFESGRMASLAIHGSREGHLYGDFEFWADIPRPRARVAVEGAPEAVVPAVAAVEELFLHPFEDALVFISWGGATGRRISEVLQPVLQSRLAGVEVFLSSTSIDPGEDPIRRMLEEGLLKARALIAVLTDEAVRRPWVIWETASAWARQQLVLPIFEDVKPEDVPGPLTTKVQGVHLAERHELDRAIRVLAARLQVDGPGPITDLEFEALSQAAVRPPP